MSKQVQIFLSSLVILLTPMSFAQTMNFRFAPVGVLVGLPSVDLATEISPHWTIGPFARGLVWNLGNRHIREVELGLRGDYYFTEVFRDGWFLSPQLSAGYAEAKSTSSYENLKGHSQGLNLSGFAGYSWFWNSFNMDLAAGLTYFGIGPFDLNDSSGAARSTENLFSGLRGYVEYNIGWTF